MEQINEIFVYTIMELKAAGSMNPKELKMRLNVIQVLSAQGQTEETTARRTDFFLML